MLNFINTLRSFFLLLPKKLHKKFFIISFCIFINSVLEFLSIGSIIPVIQSLSSSDNNLIYKFIDKNSNPEKIVGYSLLIFILIFFIRSAFNVSLNFLKYNFIVNFRMEISNKLIANYMKFPFSKINEKGSSFFLRNIQNETELTCTNLTDSIIQLFNNFLLIISILILIYFIEPKALIACFILGLILSLMYVSFYKKKIAFFGKQRQEIEKNKINLIQNIFKSFKEIKIFSSEDYFKKNYLFELQNYLNADKKYNIIQLNTRPFLEFASILVIIFYIYISFKLNSEKNGIILEIAIMGASAFRILPSVNTIIYHILSIKFFKPSLDILKLELNKNIENKPSKEKKLVLFNDKIEIENVNFSYDKKHKVLNDINLKINKNDIIGITGASGTGKTTLVDIICGFLDIDQGSVKVDGKKFSNLENMLNIGYVSQNVILLNDTIAKNVAFGIDEENINYEKVIQSLKDADIYKFILNLKNKEKSLLSEMGLNISGGQRQRISLARAFYRNSSLIVLDEPTSALDSETTKNIIKSIIGLKKTIILISHNDILLEYCNKIYMLKDGMLIEKK